MKSMNIIEPFQSHVASPITCVEALYTVLLDLYPENIMIMILYSSVISACCPMGRLLPPEPFFVIFFPFLGVNSWKYLQLYCCKLLYHCSHQVMIRIGRTDHNATLSVRFPYPPADL
jgi:hypothetical protein